MPLLPPSSASSSPSSAGRPRAAARAPSSTSSTSSQTSVHRRLRQAILRALATPTEDVLEGRPRASRAATADSAVPQAALTRPVTARAQSTPQPFAQLHLWPQAPEDERQEEQFHHALADYHTSAEHGFPAAGIEATRRDALLAVKAYQTYLRTRVIEVSDALATFKARYAGALQMLIDPMDVRIWARLSSVDVLFSGESDSPFCERDVLQFIARQMARSRRLDDILRLKLTDIQRGENGTRGAARCRELLVQGAHEQVLEKEYIQYQLEMTLLMKCQLSAICHRRRLEHVVYPPVS